MIKTAWLSIRKEPHYRRDAFQHFQVYNPNNGCFVVSQVGG